MDYESLAHPAMLSSPSARLIGLGVELEEGALRPR